MTQPPDPTDMPAIFRRAGMGPYLKRRAWYRYFWREADGTEPPELAGAAAYTETEGNALVALACAALAEADRPFEHPLCGEEWSGGRRSLYLALVAIGRRQNPEEHEAAEREACAAIARLVGLGAGWCYGVMVGWDGDPHPDPRDCDEDAGIGWGRLARRACDEAIERGELAR
jgi:hypothetical protein